MITKVQFVREIRGVFGGIVGSIKLPQHQYAGHSVRIEAATSAEPARVEDSTIQALGRWHSAAFPQYIRMPKESQASVSCSLAGQA